MDLQTASRTIALFVHEARTPATVLRASLKIAARDGETLTPDHRQTITDALALLERPTQLLHALSAIVHGDLVAENVEACRTFVPGVRFECSDEGRLLRAACREFGSCMLVLLDALANLPDDGTATLHVILAVSGTHAEVSIQPPLPEGTDRWWSLDDDTGVSILDSDSVAAIEALKRSGIEIQWFTNRDLRRRIVLTWRRQLA